MSKTTEKTTTVSHEPTPGPWRHDASYNVPTGPEDKPARAPNIWFSRDAAMDGISVAFAACVPRERIFADARLIAAAPEMLAAIAQLEDAIDFERGEIAVVIAIARLRKIACDVRHEDSEQS